MGASAAGPSSLAEWAGKDWATTHRQSLIAAGLIVAAVLGTPAAYSAAVAWRCSQRRAKASAEPAFALSVAERRAVARLYASVEQAANADAAAAVASTSAGGGEPHRWQPPSAAACARAVRAGMTAAGASIGADGDDGDIPPCELLGLGYYAAGSEVALGELELCFQQLKVDGLSEPTLLAIW